jgi:hypothetical protein
MNVYNVPSMRLPALLTFLLTLSTVSAADLTEEGKRWWSHIQVLADDKMEGRNTGSEGHKKAAQYGSGEFERDGLKPAGTSGYIPPVKFNVTHFVEASSSLAIVPRSAETPLKLGDDATLRTGLTPQMEAPGVFVGHGLVIPEKQFDDFADRPHWNADRFFKQFAAGE